MSDSPRDTAFQLHKAGYSLAEIAQHLQLKQYEVQGLLRDAKHLIRHGATPKESGRKKLGSWLLHSPLDQLKSIGDSVSLTLADGRSPSNLHSLAKHRGWTVSITPSDSGWRVTAVAKTATEAPLEAPNDHDSTSPEISPEMPVAALRQGRRR